LRLKDTLNKIIYRIKIKKSNVLTVGKFGHFCFNLCLLIIFIKKGPRFY